jgi:hypothetical protein
LYFEPNGTGVMIAAALALFGPTLRDQRGIGAVPVADELGEPMDLLVTGHGATSSRSTPFTGINAFR